MRLTLKSWIIASTLLLVASGAYQQTIGSELGEPVVRLADKAVRPTTSSPQVIAAPPSAESIKHHIERLPEVLDPPISPPAIPQNPQFDRLTVAEQPAQQPVVPSVKSSDVSETPLATPAAAIRMAMRQYSYAMSLSDRGAFASAREELVRCLRILAMDSDRSFQSPQHAEALSAAMLALEEAAQFGDYVGHFGKKFDASRFEKIHQTPIRLVSDQKQLTPIEALQAYLQFAEDNFVFSMQGTATAGPEAADVTAEFLFALAKVTQAASEMAAQDAKLADATAMTLYRAAVRIQPRHAHAANELAVLLGNFGATEEARHILAQAARPDAPQQLWQNLAKLHQQLGEAAHANSALQHSRDAERQASVQVSWVTPEAFAGPGGVNSTVVPNSRKLVDESPSDDASATPKQASGKQSPGVSWVRKLFKR